MKNQIHISKDYGWFIGGFNNNEEHRHYAIQLSIPLDGKISVHTARGTIESERPLLIQSNLVHQIVSNMPHFLLLLNPASTVGHFWKQQAMGDVHEIENAATHEIQAVLNNVHSENFIDQLNAVIDMYDCFCASSVHHGDDRINKALAYLTEHAHRIVTLEEISDHCHLSPSRFLHLFKEETGITFRRAQSWNKLIKGIPLIARKPFTEIAHEVGFSDSAHLSRTFKENFGFTPRDFLKISQFIQV